MAGSLPCTRMRLWIVVLAIGAVAGLLALYAFLVEPARLVVHEEELELPGWKAEPIRVALISDIHAGAPFISQSKIEKLVQVTNAAHPDLVFLLGDYVIQGVKSGRFIPPETTASILSGLRPRHGTYAVLGNHDGWLDRDRVSTALSAKGITVLRNEDAVVRGIRVAGLADLITDRPDIDRLRPDPDRPTIVLTHSPDVFPRIPSSVVLTLAGHTHGGQVNLPLVGRLIVPSQYGQRYAAGHKVENGRHLYVTTGVGTSIIPVRFRVTPEVVVLRIRGVAGPSPARSSRSRP